MLATRWESTADPNLEWQLARPFLWIMGACSAVAFAIHFSIYTEPDAALSWGARTFWIPFAPLAVYAVRRWRRYLEETRDIRPEASGGRDPNRLGYWLCVWFALPITLLVFAGEIAVLVNTLGDDHEVYTVAGPVVETTHTRRGGRDSATIRSAALGDVRLDVPRSVAAASSRGAHLEITAQRGLLGILYYANPSRSVRIERKSRPNN